MAPANVLRAGRTSLLLFYLTPEYETAVQNKLKRLFYFIRNFKLLYGKSIHGYYVEKKMELAKKMILENKVTVKEIAKMLGYKHASPFIETFTRQHGCSPGTLKLISA